MGIRGLSSYMKKYLSTTVLSNRRVIIDGSNMCSFLYGHRNNKTISESDYSWFARKCRRYFQALKQCGVLAYVVFPGGRYNNTPIIARNQERITDTKDEKYRCMPIFGMQTFLQVLNELDIPYVRSELGVHRNIAVLAHRWRCPVMSNSSDFFIYQLEEGCIPFPIISSSTPLQNNSIPIQLYQYRSFIKETHISYDLLPLMAIVMGNGYVDRAILQKFYRERHWFDEYVSPGDILTWLNTFKESSDTKANVLRAVLKGDDPTKDNEDLFHRAIAHYQIDEFSSFDLETFFLTNCFYGARLDDYYGNRLPAWFTEGVLSCSVSTFLQEVFVHHRVIFMCQSENVDLPSSFTCSRYIRQCIYGIAVAPAGRGNLDIFIVEHDRKEDKCWPFVVMPVREVRNFGMLPDLNAISEMLVKDRRRLFLACFNVEPCHVHGVAMDDAVVPLILSLSYWMKHARPEISEKHIDALLISVIYLHLKSLVFKEERRNMCSSILDACNEIGEVGMKDIQKGMYMKYDKELNQEWDKTILHNFAQFYSCCRDVCRLNEVLQTPFRIASPIVSFNSKFAYNLYMNLVATGLPAEDISGLSFGNKYIKLLRLFKMLKSKVLSLTRD